MSFLLTGNQQGNSGVNNASFLPADYIQRKAEIRNNLIVLCLFALVMMGVGGAFFMTNRAKIALGEEYSILKEQCMEEGKQIEALKKLQQQREIMLEKAEITAALLEPVPRWAVLSELRYRMPETVRLDTMELKGTRNGGNVGMANLPKIKTLVDNATQQTAKATKPKVMPPSFGYTLTVNGAAENNNDVADYLQSLKSSPVMQYVELTFIREQRDEKKVLRQFEITATLNSDADRTKLGDSIRQLIAKKTGTPIEELAAPAQPPTQQFVPGMTPSKQSNPATTVSEAKEGQ